MDPVTILLGGIAALASAVVGLFGFLLKSMNDRLTEMTKTFADRLAEKDSQIASLKSMLSASLFVNEKTVHDTLISQGKSGFVPMAPVIPEHQSPITKMQADTAYIATERARVVRIYKLLGYEALKPDETIPLEATPDVGPVKTS